MSDLTACAVCGEPHALDELELVFKRPDAIAALSAAERAARCRESEDLCAIWGDGDDAHRYFVRGVLPLKVTDRPLGYNIGVWMEVSRLVFNRIYELWDSESQLDEPPLDGMLANDLPSRSGALGVRGQVRLTGAATRPDFMVSDTASPLFAGQQHGVTAHQAAQFLTALARRSE